MGTQSLVLYPLCENNEDAFMLTDPDKPHLMNEVLRQLTAGLCTVLLTVAVACLSPFTCLAQQRLSQGLDSHRPSASQQLEPTTAHDASKSSYVLGSNDELAISVLGLEDLSDKRVRINAEGDIHLLLVGRVRAAGMTVDRLQAELTKRLGNYMQAPQVIVSVWKVGSQPVSVIGAVNRPGVHQAVGTKTLVEMLSLAGGVRSDAGHRVTITRRLERGRIPLAGAHDDPSGQFSVAEVELGSLMKARDPMQNIEVRSHDVITAPRAELIYVVGQVRRPGGFVLHDRETLSVLEALSLAQGLARTAAPRKAKILRAGPNASQRSETLVNLKEVLAGKGPDVSLKPYDILFVPNSTRKSVGLRTLDAAVRIGTGIAIYRR